MPFRLDRRIQLLRPTGLRTGETGAKIQQYRELRTKGAYLSTRGRVTLEDSVQLPASEKRFAVRYRADLTTAWKCVFDGIVYDVSHVGNVASERPRSYLILFLERTHGKDYEILHTPRPV